MQILGQAYRQAAKEISALVGSLWLRRAYDLLQRFHCHDEAHELEQDLRDLEEASVDEMTVITAKVEVTEAEIEEFLAQFSVTDRSEALDRVAAHFIPSQDRVERELKDLEAKAPLSALFSKSILDARGRTVAVVGNVEDDLDGAVVRHLAEGVQFGAPFLRRALEQVYDEHGFDAESLSEHLSRSIAFDESSLDLIRTGIERYLAGDWIEAISILVPQVEASIRRIAVALQQPVYRQARHGGLNVASLSSLLENQAVQDLLGRDISSYLIAMLVDPRGLNIRNDACHGLWSRARFTRTIADRLVHVLLVLSSVREREA